ncbi:MAG: ATP-binding protein, partial [Candidatus Hodarchaeota archaeon]
LSDKILSFSVDSLLVSELGERLVTKKYIALAELIKNAYDADATEVKVIFRNSRTPSSEKSEICLIDKGHGMLFQQVKDFWMRIATPHKIRNPISPRYGRKKTGDKGIGRFACQRLAKKLILESTAKLEGTDKFEYTKVEFNWEEFKPGRTLTEIPNIYETRTVSKGKLGLILRLMGLKEAWTQRDFNILRRQILGLSVVVGVKRKGFEEDPGFEVSFEAPEFEMGFGKLAEQVMDAGWGRLSGAVSDDGTCVLRLDAMTLGKVKFELPMSFMKIKGVSFDIAIIWRTKDYCRDPSIFTLGIIDEVFRSWSGIRVFLDGFRVYPYGDPGNDWLDINKDVARRLGKASEVFRRVSSNLLGVDHSRVMLVHPRNQNLIGRVSISNYPTKVIDVTLSREGFVENEVFEELKEFIRLGLEWAVIHYSHFRYRKDQEKIKEKAEEVKKSIKELKEHPKVEETVPIVNEALKVLEAAIQEDTEKLPEETKKELYKSADSAIDVVEETISYMEKRTNMLRTVASTGALMLTFVHEARTVVGRLETHANTIERLAQRLHGEEKQEFLELSKNLRATRDRFDKQIKLFHGVSKDLTITKRRKAHLKKVYDEVIDCFSGLTERFNITVESRIPISLRTGHILESEIYSILINLISNAVKAVIASEDGHKIRVEALTEEKGTILRIYDDGIGLSKESRDFAALPLVADPEGRLYKRLKEKMEYEDLLVVGEGSGMGLSIVKDIVEYYGKSCRFIDVEKPWKTCVEVTIP